MRKWRELLLSRKWLTFNEQVPYNRIINCTNIAESADMGKDCKKLDLNGRIKLLKYNCKLVTGSRFTVIRINTVQEVNSAPRDSYGQMWTEFNKLLYDLLNMTWYNFPCTTDK